MDLLATSSRAAITAFNALIDEFQSQIDEVKKCQSVTLKELESTKTAQQESSTALKALGAKVTQYEAQVADPRQRDDSTSSGLNDVRTLTSNLQDAGDELLKQYKYELTSVFQNYRLTIDSALTAKVQDLSQTVATAQTPAYPSPVHHPLARTDATLTHDDSMGPSGRALLLR